jgi:hypothetical protein
MLGLARIGPKGTDHFSLPADESATRLPFAPSLVPKTIVPSSAIAGVV